jgi:hypothetical protein
MRKMRLTSLVTWLLIDCLLVLRILSYQIEFSEPVVALLLHFYVINIQFSLQILEQLNNA